MSNFSAPSTIVIGPSHLKWQVNPKRMLFLEVTDGSQDLQAMEYSAIPELNFNTSPGTKILVFGPVECRLGVLMLTAKCVQVLGGEVEAFAEINSQEQVLSRALENGLQNNDAGIVNSRSSNTRTILSEPRVAAPRVVAPRSTNTRNISTASTARIQNNSANLMNSNSSVGNNRVNSTPVEEIDFQDDDDDILMNIDESILSGQIQTPEQSQNLSNVENISEDFDFENAERCFEDEMENLDTSFNDTAVPTTSVVNRNGSLHNTTLDKECIDWNVPYSYLSSIDSANLASSSATLRTIIIKGFISTFVSMLRPHPSLGWQLRAKVNDGTKSLEVDLQDGLLTQIIGFSAKQALKMKSSQVPKNPQELEDARKSLSQCQRTLLNLNGLLEIQLMHPRPCLVKFTPFRKEHAQMLLSRILKMKQ